MGKRTLIGAGILVVFLAAAAWWRGRDVAAQVPPVYVGLGASDSVGVGADQPAVEGWVPRFHAALPPPTRLLNLGISGATLGDVIRDELPPALDAHPRWLTLWSGVNDLRAGVPLSTFNTQLETVLAPFDRQQPRPVVLILNIPDLRHLPAFRGQPPAALDATVQAWNAAIAAAAGRHGALLVDLYSFGPELAAHPEYLSADGFHPSSAGYRRIAEYTVGVMEAHVATSTK